MCIGSAKVFISISIGKIGLNGSDRVFTNTYLAMDIYKPCLECLELLMFLLNNLIFGKQLDMKRPL